MAKKRKFNGILVTAAGIAAALIVVFAGGALTYQYGASKRVISAYGVAMCGIAHHVVLVYGDGAQRIVKGRDILTDKELTEAVENLPKAKTGMVSFPCPKAPELKVY